MTQRSDASPSHSVLVGDLTHFTGRGLKAGCPVCRTAIRAEDRGGCPNCRRITAVIAPGIRPAGMVCFLLFSLLFGALSGFSVLSSFLVLHSGPYGEGLSSYSVLTAMLTYLTGWVVGFSMHGVLCSLAFLHELRSRVVLAVVRDLVSVLIASVGMVWLVQRQTGLFLWH